MDSYLLVITPPEDICKFITGYKQKYTGHTSYSIDPHVTLYPPFYLEGVSEEEFAVGLRTLLSVQPGGVVTVDGIGYFQNKNNVIYFKPDDSSQEFTRKLVLLITSFLSGKAKNKYSGYQLDPESFTAHVTIAEKMQDEEFQKAKKELESFNDNFSFPVHSVDLYQQDEGSKKWKLLSQFPLEMTGT